MGKVIPLGQASKQHVCFNVVAVIIALEGPKTVRVADGATAVTTLWLNDGSARRDVELSLWRTDCARAASLRALDVVWVRDAVARAAAPQAGGRTDADGPGVGGGGGGGGADATNHAIFRLALRGAHAGVFAIPDGVAQGRAAGGAAFPRDVVQRAAGVAGWREERFAVLTALRRRGALWGRGGGVRPEVGRSLQGAGAERGTEFVGGGAHEQEGRREGERKVEEVTLADVMEGRVLGSAEVRGVRVSDVFVRVDGEQARSAVGWKGVDMGEVVRRGCWRGCVVCSLRAEAEAEGGTEREFCAKCGGQVRWRFGGLALVLNDGKREAVGGVAAGDVEALLFGTTAGEVRASAQKGRWVVAVLRALVADGRFTVLLARAAASAEADVWVRRVLV